MADTFPPIEPIEGTTIDDTVIGGKTPAAATVTTLEATGQITGGANVYAGNQTGFRFTSSTCYVKDLGSNRLGLYGGGNLVITADENGNVLLNGSGAPSANGGKIIVVGDNAADPTL